MPSPQIKTNEVGRPSLEGDQWFTIERGSLGVTKRRGLPCARHVGASQCAVRPLATLNSGLNSYCCPHLAGGSCADFVEPAIDAPTGLTPRDFVTWDDALLGARSAVLASVKWS